MASKLIPRYWNGNPFCPNCQKTFYVYVVCLLSRLSALSVWQTLYIGIHKLFQNIINVLKVQKFVDLKVMSTFASHNMHVFYTLNHMFTYCTFDDPNGHNQSAFVLNCFVLMAQFWIVRYLLYHVSMQGNKMVPMAYTLKVMISNYDDLCSCLRFMFRRYSKDSKWRHLWTKH